MITIAKDDDLYFVVKDKSSTEGRIYDKTQNIISPEIKAAVTCKFMYWEDYFLSEEETEKMIATAQESVTRGIR
jgi:hypothetical protein